MSISAAAAGSAGLKIIGGFLGRKKRKKASKKLRQHMMELADMQMALGERMAAYFKEQNELNWQATAPYREIGAKAVGAMDASMASGRFSAKSPAPPSGASPALPVFGVPHGESGVRPPPVPGVTVPDAPRWAEQVHVPGGAALPSSDLRSMRTRSD